VSKTFPVGIGGLSITLCILSFWGVVSFRIIQGFAKKNQQKIAVFRQLVENVRIRRIGTSIVIFVFANTLFIFSTYYLALYDVKKCVRSLNGDGPKVELKDIAFPSDYHLIYFSFNTEGTPEISRIYWRAIPWREIQIEK
jgi:hypothetical protein